MAKTPQVSMVPQSLDLAMYAGDGARLKLTVADPAGVPVPLTGTILAQIRAAREDAAAKASWSVDLSQSSQGIVTISLTGIQTASLMNGTGSPFQGFWDVQWTPAGSEPVTLIQGKANCTLDVTRS